MPAARRAPSKARARPFRPADLLKQVMIQALDVAPDGSFAVYSRRTIEKNAYRSRLWVVPMDGGRPEQLTSADHRDGRPRISPDSSTVAFVSNRSGRSQPWLVSLHGGEPRQLAELDGDVGAVEWSPDGRTVALIAESGAQRYVVGKPSDPIARRIEDFRWRLDGVGYRDQFSSVWTVRASGGRPVRRTDPSEEVQHVFWSQGGDRIGYLADRRKETGPYDRPQAWAIPARGGRPEAIGSLAGEVIAATWGPDGTLALHGVPEADGRSWGNPGLFLVRGRRVRRLGAELDLFVGNAGFGDLVDPEASLVPPVWLDADTLVALATVRGRCLPWRFGTDGTAGPLAEGEVQASTVAAGGGRVAVVATDRGRPGEVYAVEDGTLRPLTTHGSRWMSGWRRDPERHEVHHADGHVLDVWLVPARGPRRARPTVVDIHGGPHASHGPTPWLEMVALADAGFNVLYTNPRGSSSYGEAFSGTVHRDWGGPDDDDLMRVVDWAIDEGLADARRIGLLGLSYGGYLTNWLLGHHPGRFAAAVSENPVTDWVGMLGASDVGVVIQTDEFVGLGDLPEHLDEAVRRSPWVEIHRNEAPVLLLQAEQDQRCPPGQSEIVYAVLRARGRPVEMVRYPGESHYLLGIGRPDRRVDRMERIVDWFEGHLSGRRTTARR
jgi:acylaminoacyl-peptidase